MKMKKELSRTIAAGLDVPPETLCNLPMGTFRGKGELCVENHCGVLAYSHDCIRIAVKRGGVTVSGRDLTIAAMSRSLVRIRGVITVIELE